MNKYLKEHYKKKILEDVATPELSTFLRNASDTSSIQGNQKESQKVDKVREFIESSPHLYRLNPDTQMPEEVKGVKIAPALYDAITAAVKSKEGRKLAPFFVKQLESFIEKHGHIVGRTDLPSSRSMSSPTTTQWSTSRGLDDSGLINLKRFSWEKCAKETIKVYLR
jgi:hypothetical protein